MPIHWPLYPIASAIDSGQAKFHSELGNRGGGSYALTVTVAYSETFPVAGGCHCNQLDL